jgi:response regulator RpfG family c-di-GMP phosphodiesterase
MTTGRAYKKAVTKKEAIKELKKCSGTQFDPKLVDIFTNIVLV